MPNSLGVEAYARKAAQSPLSGEGGSRSALAFKLGTLFVCATLTYCSSSTTSPPKLDASSAFDGGASGGADAGADGPLERTTDAAVDANSPCRRDAGAVYGDCCLDDSDCLGGDGCLFCAPGGRGFDGGLICGTCPMK
jgi:hypothetical protein